MNVSTTSSTCTAAIRLRRPQQHWGGNELVDAPTPESVADGLVDAMRRAGTDACNLRIHVPGVDPGAARAQIARLGDEVLPLLRSSLAKPASP